MEVAISVKEMIGGGGGGERLVKIADIFCLFLAELKEKRCQL